MSYEVEKPEQLEEPSVLDYVKSWFRAGNGKRIQFPFEEEMRFVENVEEEKRAFLNDAPVLQPISDVQQEISFVEAPSIEPQPVREPVEAEPVKPFPWRSLLAFVLALIGQRAFEPPHTGTTNGFAFYLAAFAMLALALRHGEWKLPSFKPSSEETDPLTYRGLPLLISLGLGIWAFSLFRDNLFTTANVLVWIFAIVFLLLAFWLNKDGFFSTLQHARAFLQRGTWSINISTWTLLLIGATVLVFFFRFYQTTSVPPEPFSDHAEKLFDVYDVSQGQTHIFFIRNTGREAFQMYWTLLVARLFGTGLSFLSLKLGTAILGFLTLPFSYLLGKEIGGPRVGLIAFLLAGIGYWPNVISRVGLRFPLYPLFAASTLFFLLRGLRTRNRNDFLLSGRFLGIGLHGYRPMRIVPFVVVTAFVLYWLHPRQSKEARKELPIWLVMLALVSMFVFLPLLRYLFDDPAVFGI